MPTEVDEKIDKIDKVDYWLEYAKRTPVRPYLLILGVDGVDGVDDVNDNKKESLRLPKGVYLGFATEYITAAMLLTVKRISHAIVLLQDVEKAARLCKALIDHDFSRQYCPTVVWCGNNSSIPSVKTIVDSKFRSHTTSIDDLESCLISLFKKGL